MKGLPHRQEIAVLLLRREIVDPVERAEEDAAAVDLGLGLLNDDDIVRVVAVLHYAVTEIVATVHHLRDEDTVMIAIEDHHLAIIHHPRGTLVILHLPIIADHLHQVTATLVHRLLFVDLLRREEAEEIVDDVTKDRPVSVCWCEMCHPTLPHRIFTRPLEGLVKFEMFTFRATIIRDSTKVRKVVSKYHQFSQSITVFLTKSRLSLGFAFIEFASAAQAAEARDEMDRFLVKGRELEVVFAQERRKTPNEMRGRVVNQQNRGGERSNYERSSSFERAKQREKKDGRRKESQPEAGQEGPGAGKED